ncbi:6-hydroxymethylpterin diphosphokinase MptE-like protein [Litorilituus sediminis]|uniref:DUF115 domain-containing protein n=1 Tax=Litorilituus sediminis TaxID=718192 RepID=A0A4P6P2A3_9GAMM|nr:6-hydroxymethylpterin diphosphokinase MptE-like protein [Litorilituus sediminis]QBG35224.1 DUF115 domain-containing protein [Litorilituus sediminis]
MAKSIPTQAELVAKIEKLEQKAQQVEQRLKGQLHSDDIEANLQRIADRMSLLACNEDMLLAQFEENLSTFEEYFPDIYQVIKDHKPTRYFVEIVDGFANIFDEETKQHIYKYPAYLMATAQLEQYQKSPQSTHSTFEMNEENKGNFIHSKHLNEVLKVLHRRTDAENSPNKGLPNTLGSLVIFGAGLGYHLELLIAQHTIHNLYLIEPELDLFYASLYTANWRYIFEYLDSQKCNLHLSLGIQDNEFFDDLLYQTYQNGRYDVVKTFGYVHYQSPSIETLLSIYKARFYEMIQGWGFFDDGVMSLSHTLSNLKLNVPLLKKSAQDNDKHKNIPVFVVGNGPSLDQTIELIKQYQDKAIVISCGSALSALKNYGIKVDFHCEQERTIPVAEKVKEYGDAEFIKSHVLLAPSTVHPETFKLFDRAIMCPKSREPSTDIIVNDEVGKELFEPTVYINPTVSNTAIAMGYFLGFREFYLFGVDLGHKQGGQHHSSKSIYYDQNGEDLSLYFTEESQITVPGNFGGEFVCNDFFNMSRTMIEKLLQSRSGIRCVNLSDGAKIAHAQPARTIELTERASIDKASLVDDIYHHSAWFDKDYALYQRVIDKVDVAKFKEICQQLADIIAKPITSVAQGVEMLRKQSLEAAKLEVGPYTHFSLLLDGTLLHYQAMLTRILYEASDEDTAIKDFNEAVVHYQNLLAEAPSYYQENYLTPHITSADWWND